MRRSFESQYRKMLYFCYEIYYAYLYPSRNCFLFVVLECLYLIDLGAGGDAKNEVRGESRLVLVSLCV